jgi:ubiquinone/menaquinone biosynthesis C-methylase UbiE
MTAPTTAVHAPFSPLPAARSAVTRAGRTLYTAKQRAVAAVLGPAAGLWHAFIGPHEKKGDPRLLEVIDRLLREALAHDYAAAEEGLYPYSLLAPLPGWHDVRFLPEALADMPRIFFRKQRGAFALEPGAVPSAAAVASGEAGALPDYYARTFHWQTDGWMSAHSARVYEVQVEFLFFGSMDVMRRRALAWLVRGLRGDRRRMRVRVLDVACGTGRFLEQARAALPQAFLEGVDLSPFYVERTRQRLGRRGVSGLTTGIRVANAESLGGPDGVYDAVTCGFLFHELPKDARRKVVREIFRVLEPGGLLVVQDSMQRSDANGQALDVFLDWFPAAYHEPYYKGYATDEVGAMLEEAGFTVEARDEVLFSKLVVARKPLA